MQGNNLELNLFIGMLEELNLVNALTKAHVFAYLCYMLMPVVNYILTKYLNRQ